MNKNSDFYINLSKLVFWNYIYRGYSVKYTNNNIRLKGANEIVKNNLNGIVIKDMKIETMFKKIVQFKKIRKIFEKKYLFHGKSYDLKHYELYRSLYLTI